AWRWAGRQGLFAGFFREDGGIEVVQTQLRVGRLGLNHLQQQLPAAVVINVNVMLGSFDQGQDVQLVAHQPPPPRGRVRGRLRGHEPSVVGGKYRLAIGVVPKGSGTGNLFRRAIGRRVRSSFRGRQGHVRSRRPRNPTSSRTTYGSP